MGDIVVASEGMALKPPGLPDSSSFSAALMAMAAVGYVLASVAPHARSVRDLQRAWNEARTAILDAGKKLEHAPTTVAIAQRSIDDLTGIDPNTAIVKLKRARADVSRCIDAFDLALLAVDTARTKVLALRRFRTYLVAAKPDFDDALQTFERETEAVEEARRGVEALKDSNLLDQIDDATKLAVDSATAYAMARSLALAKSRPRPSVEQALASLKKVHDFARAQGVKLGA